MNINSAVLFLNPKSEVCFFVVPSHCLQNWLFWVSLAVSAFSSSFSSLRSGSHSPDKTWSRWKRVIYLFNQNQQHTEQQSSVYRVSLSVPSFCLFSTDWGEGGGGHRILQERDQKEKEQKPSRTLKNCRRLCFPTVYLHIRFLNTLAFSECPIEPDRVG